MPSLFPRSPVIHECSKKKTLTEKKSFKGQSNEYQRFLGTLWLQVSHLCDSAVYRQLNSIHKVVH